MEQFRTAVILAGGKSSRMGFDKQFLQIKNKRLLNSLIDELKQEFQDIIVVSNKPNEYKPNGFRIVCDEIKEKGPLSGIHIGLKESKSRFVYFIACDMPNINLEYIRYMKRELIENGAKACVTKHGENLEPFNSFYSVDVLPKIEKLLIQDKRALRSLLCSIETLIIDESFARKYSSELEMFLNLNTIEDLKNYTYLKV